MRKNIINIAEVELQSRPPQFAPTGPAAQRFEARIGMIGPKIGAKKLDYSHRVQEEMFYVIEGSGEVRIGGERFPIRAGDE